MYCTYTVNEENGKMLTLLGTGILYTFYFKNCRDYQICKSVLFLLRTKLSLTPQCQNDTAAPDSVVFIQYDLAE